MRDQHDICFVLERPLCTSHAQQLTLVVGRLGAVNSAEVNLEVECCMDQRSA